MTFVVILKVTPENRVAKVAEFPTEVEADAHVAEFSDRFPDAFAVERPAEPLRHWLVNMAAKKITIVIPLPRPPMPEIASVRALRMLARKIDSGEVGAVSALTGILGPAP